MKTIADLLEQNRAWARSRVDADPHFFERLVGIQRPGYLWIGCSDSRVPANQIVGLEPGEMFVHRNIANIVAPGDPNSMAVLQYAIETLGVRHVVVCGHYGCGGVRAVLDNEFGGAAHVERWLAPLRQVAAARSDVLRQCADDRARWDRLCELNVMDQVERLASTDVLLQQRMKGVQVFVHGLIYSLSDGLLHELPVGVAEGASR